MALVFMVVHSWVGFDQCRRHPGIVGATIAVAKKALLGAPGTFWCNLRKMKEIKKIPPSPRSAYRQLEDVVGCKWSVSVLQAVATGVSRPGALERHIQGISTKVLSERLRKLTGFGLLSKQVYAEVPPRTEYSLTQNGRKLVGIIDQLKVLNDEIRSAERAAPPDARKRSG